ncbi:hypothetical protein ACQ4M3_37310 [Leptolyngbya sp. AN03gr2]|uniref:hypothetical protein n=1 Tax=unclassified Leptolyngbya TaxID=2650499 RepID=UPI003D30F5C1
MLHRLNQYIQPVWVANHIGWLHTFFTVNFEPFTFVEEKYLVHACGWGAVTFAESLDETFSILVDESGEVYFF